MVAALEATRILFSPGPLATSMRAASMRKAVDPPMQLTMSTEKMIWGQRSEGAKERRSRGAEEPRRGRVRVRVRLREYKREPIAL